MADPLGTVTSAAVVFAATDIDDIVVLTVLFVTARTAGRPRPWQIVAGQYAGIGVLVAASAVVAAGLLIVPDPWTGLLGLLPVALGVRALLRPEDRDGAPPVVGGTLAGGRGHRGQRSGQHRGLRAGVPGPGPR
ncbi:cadmium resistance transporter [Plantactinospora sp. CA-290183]|uniref:cadmium resistance transporter n=1 Tax=Plantactinospora sp. CA-290183 TaxID=3240006 RepID=UPI003D8BF497